MSHFETVRCPHCSEKYCIPIMQDGLHVTYKCHYCEQTFATGEAVRDYVDFVIRAGMLVECKCESSKVVIPKIVTSIGDEVFANNSGLISVTFHEGLRYIGYKAFYGCHSLTEVTIPNAVTHIDVDAFLDCMNLKTASIPAHLESIRDTAFDGDCDVKIRKK